MAGYLKQIVLILLALNMSLFFVGLTPTFNDPIFNVFNLNYDENIGNITQDPIDTSDNKNWFLSLLGLGIVAGGIAIGISFFTGADISGIIRAGMVVLLVPFVAFPMMTIMQMEFLPSEFKLMFGGILMVMTIFGLIDFFGGVDS